VSRIINGPPRRVEAPRPRLNDLESVDEGLRVPKPQAQAGRKHHVPAKEEDPVPGLAVRDLEDHGD
jgi:hypothetical protein